MTHTIVIGEAEFEQARIEFVRGWHAQDDLLRNLGIHGAPGSRTSAGLRAALLTIGIGVK